MKFAKSLAVHIAIITALVIFGSVVHKTVPAAHYRSTLVFSQDLPKLRSPQSCVTAYPLTPCTL
jgi:hypothetical protein